jgi:integrase
MSLRHQEDLRARLRKYALDNACPMASHTAATVQAWVLALDVAPRTRNNYLAAVQTLFADGALTNHPHAAAIQLIKPSKLGKVRKEIWTPDEMANLLTNAVRFDVALVPVLALGGFAKLRASEAAACRASDLRLKDGQLILQDGGKTDGRLIPLPANCVAWLRAYAPKDGCMWPLSIDAMNAHCRKLAARCETKWRPNALRKSAQLYDTLLDADYDRVSAEAGNSPTMMRRHYVDPKLATKKDAEAWFALMPPQRKQVIIPMEKSA